MVRRLLVFIAAGLGVSLQGWALVGALSERVPARIRVELKLENNQVGVWIHGVIDTLCYREREITVQRLESETRIIPRFRNQDPKPCKGRLELIHEKIADLDPTLPSTQRVLVLGQEGWTSP
jgi:hypothetical protein